MQKTVMISWYDEEVDFMLKDYHVHPQVIKDMTNFDAFANKALKIKELLGSFFDSNSNSH